MMRIKIAPVQLEEIALLILILILLLYEIMNALLPTPIALHCHQPLALGLWMFSRVVDACIAQTLTYRAIAERH